MTDPTGPPDPLIGRLMGGRYRILRPIAAGGMGAVYAALQESLQREVAVKVIRSGLVDDAFRLRFEAEAVATSRLKDPHVVTVHDFGIDGDVPYLVFERLDGRDLRTELDRHGRLPWQRAIKILRGIAAALVAAEAVGVVHRDLKPSNIFLVEAAAGGDGVKVLDFGIAKLLEADAPSVVTDAGSVVGTAGYIAPERLLGASDGPPGDLYALGVIAWDILVGRGPFLEKSSLTLALKQLTEKTPSLAAVVNVPPRLDALVTALLDKEPEGRPPAGAVVRILDELDGGRDVTAPDLAPDAPTVPHALPTPDVATAAQTAAHTAAHTAAVLPPTPASLAAQARRGPSRTSVAVAVAVAAVVSIVSVVALLNRGPRAVEAAAGGSLNPEAASAYAAGIQLLHDANSWGAVRAFYRATTLDSGLGGAWLRIALVRRLRNATEARLAFSKAREHRASMSARDQALLEATEPCVMPDPWQWDVCEQRLRALADTDRADPEVWLELGASVANSGKLEEARAPLDEALNLEPKHPRALGVKGTALAYAGHFDEARALIDACLAASRGATDCYTYSAWLHDARGECDAIEREGREALATNPEWPDAFATLANTAVARGQSTAQVEEALGLKWGQAPDGPGKAPSQHIDEARFAALHGNFEKALERARSAMTLLAGNPNEYERAVPVRLLLEIDREIGDDADGAAVATDFEARRGVLIVDPRQNHQSIARDIGPRLWAAEERGGKLTSDVRKQRRAAWLASFGGAAPVWRRYRWFYGWAAPAETRAEAEEALAALPEFQPLPPYRPFINIAESDIGKVYALAARFADAREPLERATASCRALEQPFESTRAWGFLGDTRAQLGDVPGACAAFGVVVERWGNAHPRSLTAEAAKQQMRALQCP